MFWLQRIVWNKKYKLIESKANEWNIANNTQDFNKLRKLFAEEVIFYTKRMNISECLEKKEKTFEKYKPYAQVIVSDFNVSEYGNDMYKCSFSKRVAFNASTKTYPSYLFFRKVDGDYRIVKEGDEITNANLNYSSEYEDYINIKSVNWFLPVMLLPSVMGLIFVLFKLLKRKKTKSEDIVLPKPEINIYENPSDESTRKGREFEKYVINLFDKDYFSIVHAQSDKSFDGRHVESNQNPDFVLRLDTQSGWAIIAVECKYQSKINVNYPVKFCEEYQLVNYQNFGNQNNMNVFLVLGMGGDANNPEELYILPIDDFKNNKIHYRELGRYSKKVKSNFFYNMDFGTLS